MSDTFAADTSAADTSPADIAADGLLLHHVDSACIVVDKPAGLPAVPGRPVSLHDCVVTRLQRRFADALTVHRLDLATSGLMVFARGAAAQRALGAAFERREVDKGYVAVVHGLVAEERGEITLPLAADWPNRPRQQIDHVRGKAALTRWSVLSRDTAARRTRLALQPQTGRSHQLRVHLCAIGHPIVGDALYAPAAVARAAPRLLLHAQRLGFMHPADGQRLEFVSTPPF